MNGEFLKASDADCLLHLEFRKAKIASQREGMKKAEESPSLYGMNYGYPLKNSAQGKLTEPTSIPYQ